MNFKIMVRNIFYWLLAALLLLFFSRHAKRKMFENNVITAIVFHHPGKKLFKKIIKWLRKHGYSVISEEELLDILHKQKACPPGAIWITLDDGWKSNLNNVVPVAIRLDTPITIFVCTESTLKGTFWWRQVRQHPEALPKGCQTPEIIRELPDTERKSILESLESSPIRFVKEAMTVQDIKDIVQYPQISIGGHTATHPILPNCSTEDLVIEIIESKNLLETWISKPIITFAYPNGAFNGSEVNILQDAGFHLAVTTVNSSFSPDVDPFQIPRNEMVDEGGILENICRILGLWQNFTSQIRRINIHI